MYHVNMVLIEEETTDFRMNLLYSFMWSNRIVFSFWRLKDTILGASLFKTNNYLQSAFTAGSLFVISYIKCILNRQILLK